MVVAEVVGAVTTWLLCVCVSVKQSIAGGSTHSRGGSLANPVGFVKGSVRCDAGGSGGSGGRGGGGRDGGSNEGADGGGGGGGGNAISLLVLLLGLTATGLILLRFELGQMPKKKHKAGEHLLVLCYQPAFLCLFFFLLFFFLLFFFLLFFFLLFCCAAAEAAQKENPPDPCFLCHD